MSKTIMEQEARQSPDIINRQIELNNAVVNQVSAKLSTLKPKMVMIIGRGSSGHADILAQAKMAKNAGTYCIALVNDETSPLKDIMDDVVPLRAGKEISVAPLKAIWPRFLPCYI